MGNKKKLIKKGLINFFPCGIDTFVDLFAGSGIVAMNTKAKKYIINDINENLLSFHEMFANNSAIKITDSVKANIEKFEMNSVGVKQNTPEAEIFKPKYIAMRNYANQTKLPQDLYTCMFYAFSQQMRFNNNGDFNMPFGNGTFTEKNKEYIINGCAFYHNNIVKISNKDFRKLKVSLLKPTDFVYLDPPYINTTATYNENNGWTESDQQDLYALCEELTRNKIKFAMSNVFKNKGIENTGLINWVEHNGYKVHAFDGFNYMACGKGNANTVEVLITNY